MPTTTATTTALAQLSKTMVSNFTILTKTTTKDMTTAPVPTYKMITMIGYQDITVTVMDTMTMPEPSSTSTTTINNTAPEPSMMTETTTAVPEPEPSAGEETTTIIDTGLLMTTKTTAPSLLSKDNNAYTNIDTIKSIGTAKGKVFLLDPVGVTHDHSHS